MSVLTTLTSMLAPRLEAATTYTQSITGSASEDTQYAVSTDADGNLVYTFIDGDSVATTVAADQATSAVYTVSITDASTPVVLQSGSDGTGTLTLSLSRDLGVDGNYQDRLVNVGDGTKLTINGDTVMNARSEDGVNVYGIYDDGGDIVFNGDLDITTYAANGGNASTTADDGWSRGIYNVGGGTITVNGDTTVKTSASGSDTNGIYNGSSSHLTFNGDVDVTATGNPPNDNVHGIYNDGTTSRLTVNGNVNITATSGGSTVFGIRNQGKMWVYGDLDVYASGPRSTYGISSWHKDSLLYVDGNVDVAVVNTDDYYPYGYPTAISNNEYYAGTMEFTGQVTASATGVGAAYGINNNKTIKLDSTSAVHEVSATTTSYGSAFGIYNSGTTDGGLTIAGSIDISASAASSGRAYGIANVGGTLTIGKDLSIVSRSTGSGTDSRASYGINNTSAGTLHVGGDTSIDVSTTKDIAMGIYNEGADATLDGGASIAVSSTGNSAFAVYNTADDSEDGSVGINADGGSDVTIDGNLAAVDLVDEGTSATTSIVLDTQGSYFRGNVLSADDAGLDTSGDARTGATWLTFSNGASWQPTGTGSITSDFGSGGLILASGGVLDMSAYWGSFSPGSVPEYSLRTLTIDSSTGDGTVTLEDGAKFLLLSDIAEGKADEIVFGSGISTFSATGTQSVGIVYDPVLDDTSWIDEAAIQVGKLIDAYSDITVIDASEAADGTASLASVAALESSWAGTYENDLIAFSYQPTLELSADGTKVLLTGIQIIGNGSGDSDGNADSGNTGDGSSDVGEGTSGDDSSGESAGSAIRPSETVLTAVDAADSTRRLWLHAANRARQHALRTLAGGVDAAGSGIWMEVSGGHAAVDMPLHSRSYAQNTQSLTLGFEHGFRLEHSELRVGTSFTRGRASADYRQGDGKLATTGVTAYTGLVGESGGYLWFAADVQRLSNDYRSIDSEGRRSSADLRTRGYRASLETGWTLHMDDAWSIVPQVSVSAGTLEGDRHRTSTGVEVRVDDADVTLARAGAVLQYVAGGQGGHARRVYLRAMGIRAWGDTTEVSASKDGGEIATGDGPRRRDGYELAAGASLSLMQSKMEIFAEAGRQRYTDADEGWTATAGLRLRW